MQRGSFHTRHKFNNADIAHVLNQPVDDVIAKVAMCHLPALETQRRFHLVAFTEETHSLIFLGLVIVFIHGDRKFNFLDDNHFLFLACRAITLVLLVQELSVVLDAADRWYGVR